MSFVPIARYGITWSESDRTFVIGLFSNPRNLGPNPDFEIRGLSAEEVSALIQMFQADTDKRVHFDPQSRKLSTGVEPV